MNIYTVDVNERKEQCVDVIKSSSPSDVEKQISREISDKFDEQFGAELKTRGYQSATFDVQLDKNTISIDRTFLLKDNGEVEIVQLGYKRRLKGHSISTRIKERMSGLAMSVHIPTPFLIFHKEIENSFVDGLIYKLGFATIIGSILSFSNLSSSQIIYSLMLFTFIATIDLILGLFPNTVKGKRRKKEHTIQAKTWLYFTNLLVLIGFFGIHLFLKGYITDPNQIQEFFINSIYTIGGIGVATTYLFRMGSYFITANNKKVHPVLVNIFKGK